MKKTPDEKRILRTALIIPALAWVLFFNVWESLYHFFERINRKIDAYMTDYFDVGWYTDVRVGDWNRPYEMVK